MIDLYSIIDIGILKKSALFVFHSLTITASLLFKLYFKYGTQKVVEYAEFIIPSFFRYKVTSTQSTTTVFPAT